MNFSLALKNVRRGISEISKKDRRKILLLCLLIFTSVFIGIVGAAVYNSMYMQSGIGVEG